MKAELDIPAGAERQLLLVTQKATGKDKPSGEEMVRTLAGLATLALRSAYAQCAKPEPVSQPLPPLAKTIAEKVAGVC